MTVETEVTRVIVAGNAVTTAFSFSFPIPGSSATDQTNAELLLFGTDSSITVLADNLWSITGVDTGVGGTFTYPLSGPAITTGAFLTLTRIVPYEQTTTLSAQGAYSPAVVEAALDNLAFQTEQLNTWRLQSIRAPITDAALADLPTKAFRAGAFLKFDSNGDPSTASSTTGLAGSILVGVTTTASSLTTDLLITGSSVASVVTVSGITTATINSGTPALTNAHIFVGNGSNIATDVAMSGDATMANTGALTLATVNGNVGAFTNVSLTVNAKGLITAAASGSGATVVPPVDGSGSTLSLTTGQSGATVLLDRAAGCAVALPAATGSGVFYNFVTKTVLTSNNYTIAALKSHSDTFLGIFIGLNTSTVATVSKAASAGSSNFITLNGGTTGGGAGVPGEHFTLVDIAANVWMVMESFLFFSDPAASPFSAV